MTLTEREKKRKGIIGAMISSTESDKQSEIVSDNQESVKQETVNQETVNHESAKQESAKQESAKQAESITTTSMASDNERPTLETEVQETSKEINVENMPLAKILPKTLDGFVKSTVQGFQKENILVEPAEQPADVSDDMVNELVAQLMTQKEKGVLDAATLRELTQQTIQGYTSKSTLKIACCVPQMVSVCNACEYRRLCPKCLSDTEKVRTTIYIPKELNLACNLMFKMDSRFKNLNKSVVITEFLRSLCGDYYIQMAHENLEKYRK